MTLSPDLEQRLESARTLNMSGAQAHRVFMKLLNKRLAGFGVTPLQFFVLHQVHGFGPLAQSDIADFLAIESQTVVRLLDDMERNGWVRRVPDTRDRRVKRIHLADHERTDELLALFNELNAEALSEFSNEEMQRFVALQKKFVDGLARLAG